MVRVDDDLGMGQNLIVLQGDARGHLDPAGAGSGCTRNISVRTDYHVELEAELADLHGKKAGVFRSHPPTPPIRPRWRRSAS